MIGPCALHYPYKITIGGMEDGPGRQTTRFAVETAGAFPARQRLTERAAVMGQDSKKDNGTQNKPAMEKVELAKLAPLPTGATDAEREAYIKAHHDSSVRCKERHLEGAWYIGKELPRLKTAKRLVGKRWDDYCQMRFGFGARQAQDYTKIA